MGKAIRIVLVLLGLAAIVLIGVQGAAWAHKLGIGGPAIAAGASVQGMPAAELSQPVLPAAARPQGTVITAPTVVAITPGSLVIVGNCATAFTASAPAGVTFTATVVDSTALPGPFPGTLLSCGIRIDAKPVTIALLTEIEVCFPIPPTKTALAQHHDQTQWLKTTEEIKNGQSCVTLPVNDPNPTFTALFGQ
jgi:hypothetical protein